MCEVAGKVPECMTHVADRNFRVAPDSSHLFIYSYVSICRIYFCPNIGSKPGTSKIPYLIICLQEFIKFYVKIGAQNEKKNISRFCTST